MYFNTPLDFTPRYILPSCMKITPSEDKKTFSIEELTFADLKTIRDSCQSAAKGGLTQAATLAKDIEALMGNITI